MSRPSLTGLPRVHCSVSLGDLKYPNMRKWPPLRTEPILHVLCELVILCVVGNILGRHTVEDGLDLKQEVVGGVVFRTKMAEPETREADLSPETGASGNEPFPFFGPILVFTFFDHGISSSLHKWCFQSTSLITNFPPKPGTFPFWKKCGNPHNTPWTDPKRSARWQKDPDRMDIRTQTRKSGRKTIVTLISSSRGCLAECLYK